MTTTKRRKRLQPRELGAHSSRAAPAMFPARSFARRAASAGPLGRRSTREQQMRSRPRSTQPRRLARAARSRAASPSQVCPVQTGQLPKQPAFRGAASRVDGTFPILSPPEKLSVLCSNSMPSVPSSVLSASATILRADGQKVFTLTIKPQAGLCRCPAFLPGRPGSVSMVCPLPAWPLSLPPLLCTQQAR